MNEAAILTARRRKEAIGLGEIDDAVDRIIAGMEGRPLTDGRSKRLIALPRGWSCPDRDPGQGPRPCSEGHLDSPWSGPGPHLVLT